MNIKVVRNLGVIVILFGVIALAMGIVFIQQGYAKEAFLREAMTLTGLDLSAALGHFQQSIETTPHIAAAIRRGDLQEAAVHFRHIAHAETEAYTCLSQALE